MPLMNVSAAKVSICSADFVISFDVCVTRNGDLLANILPGLPIVTSMVHKTFMLTPMSVKSLSAIGFFASRELNKVRRSFECLRFNARWWVSPVRSSYALNARSYFLNALSVKVPTFS